MKHMTKITIFSMILLLISMNGCLKTEPGWKDMGRATVTGDVNALMEKAGKLKTQADSRDKVLELIRTYKEIVAIEPENHGALTALGDNYCLLGMAYSPDTAEKKKAHLKSMAYCEKAMYTNREFAALVDKGESLWDACRVLGEREIEDMFYWYCSSGQIWTECLSGFTRLVNFQKPLRGKKVLDRMAAINEKWNNGQVMFCLATLYTIPPSMLGGDMKKGADYFRRAIELGPDYPHYYLMRAKYYHTKMKDRDSFKKDLEHVLALDPAKSSYPYTWGSYYRADARRMLDQMNEFF